MTGPWVWPKKQRYTPELMAEGQYRFEETDEPVPSIAADFGILATSFWRLAQREGWKRRKPPSRDVPRSARLQAQAMALERAALIPTWPPAGPDLGPSPGHALPLVGRDEAAGPPALPVNCAAAAPAGIDLAAIDDLERQVVDELAAVKALRAAQQGRPRPRADIEGTARTLARLTDTLHTLQRMRCGPTVSGQNDDDLPVDMDEFRLDLARRIDAFVQSELDAQDADRDSDSAPVEEIR